MINKYFSTTFVQFTNFSRLGHYHINVLHISCYSKSQNPVAEVLKSVHPHAFLNKRDQRKPLMPTPVQLFFFVNSMISSTEQLHAFMIDTQLMVKSV